MGYLYFKRKNDKNTKTMTQSSVPKLKKTKGSEFKQTKGL